MQHFYYVHQRNTVQFAARVKMDKMQKYLSEKVQICEHKNNNNHEIAKYKTTK